MGNKALDLATTMVLRDTRPGCTCAIPVNYEGVGGLKVVDHCDCAGCYFEGEDCPNIDRKLTCNRSGKTVIYMPVPADEMGVTVSDAKWLSAPSYESEPPIDHMEAIGEATAALACATNELRSAKQSFEDASKWYAEARNNWTAAWEAVAKFARASMSEATHVPVVSIPTVQHYPAEPVPACVVTVSPTVYDSPDDALDERTVVNRIRPTLLPSKVGNSATEDKIIAVLGFDEWLTVAEVMEKINGKRSTVTNSLARLVGCGLLVADVVPGSRRALRYRLSDAAERKPAPGTPEELIYKQFDDGDCRTAYGLSGRTGIPEKSVGWVANIMVRAGLLTHKDGVYTVAKKGE